jgi:hypothetical protein
MCLNEIGLHAPKMYTILSSVVNIIGQETYIPIDEHKNLHFDNEEDIHVTPKTLYDKLLRPQFRYANHLVPIACFISMVMNSASRKKYPFNTHHTPYRIG